MGRCDLPLTLHSRENEVNINLRTYHHTKLPIIIIIIKIIMMKEKPNHFTIYIV
jgi:hypothetical protein